MGHEFVSIHGACQIINTINQRHPKTNLTSLYAEKEWEDFMKTEVLEEFVSFLNNMSKISI